MKFLPCLILFSSLSANAAGFKKLKDIEFADELINNEEVSSKEEKDSFTAFSVLSVQGTFGFYRIDSVDKVNGSKAALLSEPAPGMNLSWEQHWKESWKTGVAISRQDATFQRAGVDKIENRKVTMAAIEMSSTWNFKNLPTFSLLGGQKTTLIARGKSTGVATVDDISSQYVGVAISPNLVRVDKLSLDLNLGYNSIFGQKADAYTVKAGSEWYVAPTLIHKLNSYSLELSVQYLKRQQDTSISTQEFSAFSTRFGINFDIGK